MDIKDIVSVIGILIMGGSPIYLLWTIRSSIEKEREKTAKS